MGLVEWLGCGAGGLGRLSEKHTTHMPSVCGELALYSFKYDSAISSNLAFTSFQLGIT